MGVIEILGDQDLSLYVFNYCGSRGMLVWLISTVVTRDFDFSFCR